MTWLWFTGVFKAHRFFVDERGNVGKRASCGHAYARGRPWAEGDPHPKCSMCSEREAIFNRTRVTRLAK